VRAAQMVLRALGKPAGYRALVVALAADEDGTDDRALRRVLRARGCVVAEVRSWAAARRALAAGRVLIAGVDGDHYAVWHGLSDTRVFLADPSIRRMLGRTQAVKLFRRRWDRWALAVSAS